MATKNDCWYARIRDRRSIYWNRYPLYPSAKCSGAQWVRTGDVYCVAGMSHRPFCILYIKVSLAMHLRCSKDCH